MQAANETSTVSTLPGARASDPRRVRRDKWSPSLGLPTAPVGGPGPRAPFPDVRGRRRRSRRADYDGAPRADERDEPGEQGGEA